MDAGSARRTVASSNQRVCQAGRGPLQARFEFAVIEQFAGPVSGEIRLGLPLLAAFPENRNRERNGGAGDWYTGYDPRGVRLRRHAGRFRVWV